ncbi:MAG: 2OG-Fe(II) oxygenase [Pseudomonadota bacterium]
MAYLDYDKLAATAAEKSPFEYLIVEEFLDQTMLEQVLEDYPEVPGPGSHPPSVLSIEGHFKNLMEELDQPRFRELIEEKFDVDLTDKPTMYTVRGFCRKKDGSMHTDSKTKVITVLLYMNEKWDQDGGRLRILKNGTDLDDFVAEVPPHGGTLLVFKRSDNSWHGHEPFEGKRRAVQMNWVTSDDVVEHEQRRHRFSSKLKKWFG